MACQLDDCCVCPEISVAFSFGEKFCVAFSQHSNLVDKDLAVFGMALVDRLGMLHG